MIEVIVDKKIVIVITMSMIVGRAQCDSSYNIQVIIIANHAIAQITYIILTSLTYCDDGYAITVPVAVTVRNGEFNRSQGIKMLHVRTCLPVGIIEVDVYKAILNML